jgi:hypothetical protein
VAAALPAWRFVRHVSAKRASCISNLKQIVLAMHAYHQDFGSFPPAYVADADGRPMHSWRVLILPYLEELPLYKDYRFDEPWDGPNNRLLHASEVRPYACPVDHNPNGQPGMTSYVLVTGPGTVFNADQTMRLADVSDGTGQTLLVVEVHNSGIHWMEPRDLALSQMATTINSKRGQGISSRHPTGVCRAT